ncbi:MAG: hypothetical protein ACI93T_003860 [Porticoccaceae bacterium]|jgi:hypothetical protein
MPRKRFKTEEIIQKLREAEGRFAVHGMSRFDGLEVYVHKLVWWHRSWAAMGRASGKPHGAVQRRLRLLIFCCREVSCC